jgi:arylsulfatase A-like enzyme
MYDPENDGRGHPRPPYGYWRESGLTEADLRRAHACYAGEVSLVDRWVGYLLEAVEFMGLAKDTAIVFTTDHGFYFGEHGLLGKMIRARRPDGSADEAFWDRSPLYEEVVHVPLIIRTPDTAPGRSAALTSAVDIMPTIIELAGLEPPEAIHGRSLVPVLGREDAQGHEFIVTSPPLRLPGEITRVVDDAPRNLANVQMSTITRPPWALLYSAAGEPSELYNLGLDPRQGANLIDAEREKAEELRACYYDLLEACGVGPQNLARRSSL